VPFPVVSRISARLLTRVPNDSGRWVIGFTIDVSGLSSSAGNAEIIAEAVASQISGPSQRLILLGYSKGTTDILHFLAAYPELALRIEAVLSVAGAVNGSPLADRYSEVEYDNWLAGLFPEDASPGTAGYSTA
jgi:predicted esterase